MEVVLIQAWSVAPEGHTVVHYRAGDVLTGRAAELALRAGVGFTPVAETKIEPPVERKKRVRK